MPCEIHAVRSVTYLTGVGSANRTGVENLCDFNPLDLLNQLMKSNERAALVNLKRELEKTLNLVDYRVFGSKARGEESPESDIDVMIEVENYTPDVEALIDELIFEINLDHDCLISAVIFGSKELHEGPLRESPIYRSISREGIRI